MPTTLPDPHQRAHRSSSAGDIFLERNLVGGTVFVASALAILSGVLPGAVVLPALSVLVVVAGLALGTSAWLTPTNPAADARWQVAGLLVFFGFAAAIVCEKDEVLRLFGALPGH